VRWQEVAMSHIKKETVIDVTGVAAELLEEGLKVVGQLLQVTGVKVTEYFYNFDALVQGSTKGVKIILGLDPEGYGQHGRFGGIGVGIDASGKLAFLGTSEYWDGRQANQERQSRLQQQVERLLPGAILLAARIELARASGKQTELIVNPETRQLQLVVEA
jgi:hypothetical protein